MKQRILLSLLSCLALVYVSLPRLPWVGGAKAELFAWIWLGLALVAFGGNVSALLYNRKKEAKSANQKRAVQHKQRIYGRGRGI